MKHEFAFNEAFPDATDEQLWEQIRAYRNTLLKQTDWSGLLDCTISDPAWREYRQQLRNIPQNFTNPRDVVWPVLPTVK